MQRLQERLAAIHRRQQWQWSGQCFAWGLAAGGLVGTLAGVVRILRPELSAAAVWAPVAAGPVLGLVWSWIRPAPLREAAVAADRQFGLKDRVTTAWTFLTKGVSATVWQSLQIADAETHLAGVDPCVAAPYRAPRSLPAGLLLTVTALVLAVVTTVTPPVVAAPVADDVVSAQAVRVSDELKELEQFNAEEPDEELEQLLKELAKALDEMKEPGVDPKEALAKLSEMEASLQSMQEQLASPQTEAQLKATGDALALAQSMQAAGQALSEGKLDEAAEQLQKLELPELERQTEKAVTEKLEQLAKNSGDGMQRQLQEALQNLAAGLSQGNSSKFKDGAQGLAGECKSQSRRKKLSDLLRKQCQCLGECKSECESQCNKTGMGKGKGGKNWGLGASGNEPGDATAKLKSPNQMNITGQESNQGDVDVETTHTPEARQEAVRQYREKVDKYQQLSESVLDAEPIPLGHRQTIRRYFELIRPDAAEADAVNAQTSPATE
jgi:hypothetical protein